MHPNRQRFFPLSAAAALHEWFAAHPATQLRLRIVACGFIVTW